MKIRLAVTEGKTWKGSRKQLMGEGSRKLRKWQRPIPPHHRPTPTITISSFSKSVPFQSQEKDLNLPSTVMSCVEFFSTCLPPLHPTAPDFSPSTPKESHLRGSGEISDTPHVSGVKFFTTVATQGNYIIHSYLKSFMHSIKSVDLNPSNCGTAYSFTL